MKNLLLFTVILGFVALSSANINCNRNRCTKKGLVHTLCEFKRQPSPNCGEIQNIGISQKEKEEIVNKHNELREFVAAGLEKRGAPGPQPAAQRMPKLIWDVELSDIAKRWAYQCHFGHDQCRDVDRFEVGQNVGQASTTADEIKTTPKEIIELWYNEVSQFNKNEVSHFTGKAAGHYTQMVWAKTTRIGCGKIVYKKDGLITYHLVCNYGPAGNVLGEEVYQAK